MSPVLPAVPVFDPATCGVGGTGSDGCRACVERCPYDALTVRRTPHGARVAVDPERCQRCGACSGVCPTSAVTRSWSTDEQLISAVLSAAAADPAPVVAITCPASAARVGAVLGAEHTVVAASLLIVNETHLLAAIAGGARGVLLVGCPRCTHTEPFALLDSLSVSRVVLDHPRRVSYVEDDGSDALTDGFVAVGALSPAGVELPGPVRRELTEATTRRQRLRALLPCFGAGSTTPLAATGFGAVHLDVDACVACGACAVACPTDALMLDAEHATLSVTDLECIGCGTCVSVCPDDAVTLEDAVPVGAAALIPRRLLTDVAVECRSCQRPYAPQRLLDHAQQVLRSAGLDPDEPRFQLGICPSCRRPDARSTPIDVPAETSTQPSRRSVLKGLLATAVIGAALPLVRGTPSWAAEEAPVITPGRLGMVIDLERCIGCHACTNVCKAENNVPLGGFRDWVEEHVLGEYPNAEPYFLPKLCNHCDEPGCLKACPTGAIYKREDGIVELDSSICLACQACMQGCPYGMTFYNSARNTADKCNYCAHRVDEGLRPACVEVCPSQCRIFGDLDDPDSAPSRYLAEHQTTVMRPEIGFGPNTQYVGLPGELNR